MRAPAEASRRKAAALAAVFLTLALALGSVAGAADRPVYRWVDEAGVPHFTDRAEEVPPAFRDQLGLPADPEEAGAPPAPAARAPEAMAGPALDAEALAAWRDMDAAAVWKTFAALAPGVLVGGLLVALALFAVVAAFGAVVLLVACRLVGQERPGFGKAMGIVAVQILAGMLVAPGVVLVTGPPASLGGLVGLQAANAVATLGVHAAVLRAMLCETFGRALGVALMVVLVSFVLGVALALGFVTCGLGSAALRAG